jgi:hypothetical protein
MSESTIYHKGDPVPHEWFSVLDQVGEVTFGCDCEVTMIATNESFTRYIEALNEGSMFIFNPVEPGAHMRVEFVNLTHLHSNIKSPHGMILKKWGN